MSSQGNGVERSDTELADAIRRGDAHALTTLVETLHPALCRMARLYVPGALAEEVVQETWLAVVRSIDTFEGRATLKTWVYRIMLNKVRTLARRESKVVPFASVGPAVEGHPAVPPSRLAHPDLGASYWPAAPSTWHTLPEPRLESAELRGVVAGALAKLPDSQREVVTLRDVEGWTGDEVCEALGITSVNQRVLLHRARSTIRAAVEEYFDGG